MALSLPLCSPWVPFVKNDACIRRARNQRQQEREHQQARARAAGRLARSCTLGDAAYAPRSDVMQQQQQQQAAPSSGEGSSASAAACKDTSCHPHIRRATRSDLQALYTLEGLTAEGATWSDQQIENELSRERATVLVVDQGAGPVGWAVGWAVPGELHVMNVAVHPGHRRRGHARALLASLIQLHRGAEEVLLEVRVTNQPALTLYHSFGFERVGLRKKYYQDGEDAVLMTLRLDASSRLAAAGSTG